MLNEFQPPEGFAFRCLPEADSLLEEAARLGPGHILAAEGEGRAAFAVSTALHCTAGDSPFLPHM
ncbi:MAG: hypothetical protein LUG57_11085 [Oscillospiraceae bacterium]|nr:hypothetical protein [Oscillospiraceae bacterium]